MQEITLQLTIDEANLILEALGNLPFAKVYGLIGKIQEQAGQQLSPDRQASDAVAVASFPPTIDEMQ